MAGVLAVELSGPVEAEVGAQTVGIGRRALASGLRGEKRGTALLAGEADVRRRARVTCIHRAKEDTRRDAIASAIGRPPSTTYAVPGALPDFVRAQEERKASERGRDQRDALCQRPMNRPLVSKARPASIIKSREANIACVDPKITKDEIG